MYDNKSRVAGIEKYLEILKNVISYYLFVVFIPKNAFKITHLQQIYTKLNNEITQ